MAKMTAWSAGFWVTAALAFAIPCFAQSAPSAKPEPLPHPGPSAKIQIKPQPRPEPPAASSAKPTAAKQVAQPKRAEVKKSGPTPRRTAKRAHRLYAQIPPARRRESREERWHYSYREERSVQEGHPPFQAMARTSQCDEVCAYREWAERYRTWYERYGSAYGAYRTAPSTPQGARITENPARRGTDWRVRQWRESESARLDPWHGYDSRDGLENGY
ncbi:MAG TPA: hypothetical protein VGM68_03860 [Rhizomicrobium sp.]|jgi:hypothetical protein